jgi:hypothetical protein
MTDAGIDGVDEDVATAVGLVLLADASLSQAADHIGVTQWELEEAIEGADLAERCGIDGDGDVAAEIDSLLDGED